jgi:hypothetical protein
MPVRVRSEITIPLAPSQVAAFACDPENVVSWYANIKSMEWVGQPGLRVGAEMDFVAHFLGRRISYRYRIREWVLDRRLVMSTSQGPFPMETVYSFEPEGQGTRMALENNGDPTGFWGLAAPVMELAMRRANQADLARLKQVLLG